MNRIAYYFSKNIYIYTYINIGYNPRDLLKAIYKNTVGPFKSIYKYTTDLTVSIYLDTSLIDGRDLISFRQVIYKNIIYRRSDLTLICNDSVPKIKKLDSKIF